MTRATARQAGAKIHHVVYDTDDMVIGERRSAHRYHYAICKRSRGGIYVTRWSRASKTSGAEFAVPIQDAP
jgi:hypothetical protein